MPKPEAISSGKCPADDCPNVGILYFNPRTKRGECFDCAHPKPTLGQVFAGIVDIFKDKGDET